MLAAIAVIHRMMLTPIRAEQSTAQWVSLMIPDAVFSLAIGISSASIALSAFRLLRKETERVLRDAKRLSDFLRAVTT